MGEQKDYLFIVWNSNEKKHKVVKSNYTIIDKEFGDTFNGIISDEIGVLINKKNRANQSHSFTGCSLNIQVINNNIQCVGEDLKFSSGNKCDRAIFNISIE